MGGARGEPGPIRRAFASPSWLRSLVHSRFRPPGCARLQGRLIRPGLTPRLRFLRTACSPLRGDLRPGLGDEGRVGWRRGACGAAGECAAGRGGLNGTGLRVPQAPRQSRGRFAARGPVPLACSRPEDPSRSFSVKDVEARRAWRPHGMLIVGLLRDGFCFW